ncbi:hypothetical protein [Cupriavidus sp. RAF12]|uniref:hypothetical protein n=1 Tax=Cupriavidus sp. RAF12 TaxID=3233050 RepID=UPI003F8E0D9D
MTPRIATAIPFATPPHRRHLSAMTAYLPASILLEAHYFGDDAEMLRLPCASVTVQGGAIVVDGVEIRHLRALRWTPDYLSFDAGGDRHRYPVSRPAVVGPQAARFALL